MRKLKLIGYRILIGITATVFGMITVVAIPIAGLTLLPAWLFFGKAGYMWWFSLLEFFWDDSYRNRVGLFTRLWDNYEEYLYKN